MTERWADSFELQAKAALIHLDGLATQARIVFDKAGGELRAQLSDVDQAQRRLDPVIAEAVRRLTASLNDPVMVTYVLACWLDTTFPRTMVATYAARRALAALDPPNANDSPL